LANLAEKFSIGNGTAIPRLIGFPDDRGLLNDWIFWLTNSVRTHSGGILKRPAIQAIVTRIETTLREPGNITGFKGAISDGVEGAMPIKQVGGSLEEQSSGKIHR
jgi:hypothetical protein